LNKKFIYQLQIDWAIGFKKTKKPRSLPASDNKNIYIVSGPGA
jgi:hypothetical protein